MHAKFHVSVFQNNTDIHHHSLNFVCLVFLGHLLVQVTKWFLAYGSDIWLMWKISDLSIKPSPQIYATYFLILI